jgi:adenosylcobinamide-phosphate guanylyltransferase
MALKIIMAGGKSERIGEEKPILRVNGIPLLLRVHSACRGVVAVSKNTPETKKLCLEEGIEFVETPGKGYVEDIQWLLKEFGEFISVASDIPFLSKEDIDYIEEKFSRDRSLTGFVHIRCVPKGGGQNAHNLRCLVGINTVTFGEEEYIEFKNPFLAYNVNTRFDLHIANVVAKFVDEKLMKGELMMGKLTF